MKSGTLTGRGERGGGDLHTSAIVQLVTVGTGANRTTGTQQTKPLTLLPVTWIGHWGTKWVVLGSLTDFNAFARYISCVTVQVQDVGQALKPNKAQKTQGSRNKDPFFIIIIRPFICRKLIFYSSAPSTQGHSLSGCL